MKHRPPCLVCGAESSGVNFSVRSCKPCGSFYRRCIAERKKYVCRNGNSCPIDAKQRQQCRACRLRKCIEVGMTRETLSNNPPVCAVPPLPETPTTNLSFSQKYSLLNDLMASWNNFKNAQQSLLNVVNASSCRKESDEEYRLITKAEYERLEMGVASLILTMLNETYPAFLRLDEKQKFRVYKRFTVRFFYLYKIYMSSIVFPDETDDRVVLYNGYCMSVENLDYFFSGCDMSNVNMKEVKSAARAMFDKTLQIKRQFVKLKVREIEAVFLGGSLFYDELDDIEFIDTETELVLKGIRRELFENMVENYGTDDAVPRFAQMTKFISDINKTCVYSTESMILVNMILPKGNNVNTWLTVDEDSRVQG